MAEKNRKHDNKYYAWVVYEWIKSTYDEWGTDITSIWEQIKEEFPNAAKAFKRMHVEFDERALDKAKPKKFEKPQSVCEAVANLIPAQGTLYFDVSTREVPDEYKDLSVCPWNRLVEIRRVDLLLAIMLFAEDFATQPLSCKNIDFRKNYLKVSNRYITFEIEKVQKHTFVRIRVKDVCILEYEIGTTKT